MSSCPTYFRLTDGTIYKLNSLENGGNYINDAGDIKNLSELKALGGEVPTQQQLSQEPWYDSATNEPATLNTQNIYTLGDVGIGTDAPNATLDIHDTTPNVRIVDTDATDATTATNRIDFYHTDSTVANRLGYFGYRSASDPDWYMRAQDPTSGITLSTNNINRFNVSKDGEVSMLVVNDVTTTDYVLVINPTTGLVQKITMDDLVKAIPTTNIRTQTTGLTSYNDLTPYPKFTLDNFILTEAPAGFNQWSFGTNTDYGTHIQQTVHNGGTGATAFRRLNTSSGNWSAWVIVQ